METNAKLIVQQGASVGQEYTLTKPQTVLGRDPGVDIVINSNGVSRRHARITQQGEQYFIEDLGSSNGTYVNGQRIVSRVQLSGDVQVQLGQGVVMRFALPSSATVLMTPPQAEQGMATMLESSMDFPASSAPPTAPKLLVTVGNGPTTEHVLTAEMITFGRAANNGIVLNSPIVSRQHGQLRRSPAGYQLIPSPRAGNPVTFGGQSISGSHNLQDGDHFYIGQPGAENVVKCVFVNPTQATTRRPAIATPEDSGATQLLDDTPPPPSPSPQVPAGQRSSAKTMLQSAFKDAFPPTSGTPTLKITIAGSQPQSYPLTSPQYTIGRARENDIVINSKIVSRRHARLEKHGTGYRLIPFPDTSNPTLFEGRPLTNPRQLGHNDLMRIGGLDPGSLVTLTYTSPEEAVAYEARSIQFGDKNAVSIGRDQSNDITLDSPTVSRFHAQVERVGQRFRIRDLRSSNGTFINGEELEGERWLQANDDVRIGNYRFVVGQDSLEQFDASKGLRVEATGINKWVRKDLNILQDINLVFQPREFIVVVGQSGGGKTTLVDSIAGYRPATHGTVTVNDINVYKNFEAVRNDIGYVPQKDIIHSELTVFQALDYSARLRMPPDTTTEERHKRIDEVLNDLDIAHRKDTQISSLSGGQIKRVSIGVELITQPGLFFLDEPTSGLDPGTETALMQLMRRLADQGRTIALITHATKNVMLADKVVFLARGGYLAWFGPPDEALAYFDQYRSERDRRSSPMEFDNIYTLLEQQNLGTAAEWGERYKQHPAYQKYIAQPLTESAPVVEASTAERKAPQPKRKRQISSIRQFGILSARNIKILTRDRFSLALMLAAAPLVSLLDVILSIALGNNLFDRIDGSIQNVMITLFLLSVYGVMVGGLAQMREIVKEQDVYKRERLVNLRLFPYIMSKIWVAAILALYQAGVYTVVHYIVFEMPGGYVEFGLIYVTLTLATMSGMMLGLFASAVAPNPNSAPLITILLMMPQIVLGGALVPLPDAATGVTSTRWAYQAFMAITGAGSDVDADACWDLGREEREALANKEDAIQNCACLGPNILRQCNFPGVAANYTPAFDEPPPMPPTITEPTPLRPQPEPPERPDTPPQPEQPDDPTDQIAMAAYQEELQAWQAEVDVIVAGAEAEFAEFEADLALYQQEAEAFAEAQQAYALAQEDYARRLATWKQERGAAFVPAQATIDTIYDGFSWTFVDKNNTELYYGTLGLTWTALSTINFVLFVLILFFQKRKDRVS